jgi:bcr-type benzoyl-CoA reductase subunit C
MGEQKVNAGKEPTADDILRNLGGIARDPFETLRNWKESTRKKMIGCMPMQIPEEIIHAAGALPIVIPEGIGPVTAASKHIQYFFCGYARSVVDSVLKGQWDCLDGLVTQDTCHTMRPLFDIIEANHPFDYMRRVFMPVAVAKKQAKPFLLGELERFRASVGKFVGKEIDDESLRASVDIYNTNRDLMMRLYDLRRQRPGLLTVREMVDVTLAGMLMPKEEHNDLLKKLLAALPDRTPPLSDVNNRVRLVLTGSLCEAPPAELLALVEDLGGIVVDDDLYTGSRYFVTRVPSLPNPIEGLAEAYLHMAAPCPTRIYPEMRLGPYLVDRVKRAEAKGLIIILVKYCEAHDYTYPHMRRHLDPAGIPYLMIKTEHETSSVEQLKTRLQAFFEIIRGH